MDIRHQRATAVALFGMGAFQALLAAGAPWANLSWGGKHRGTLPDHLRAVSGAAAIAYVGTASFIASGAGSLPARSRTFTAISLLMSAGTIANAMSRSRAERLVWTPTTAATAALAWRSRR
jgi:ABC-type transport system involved in cytochrome c biogenesis permease subunit